MAPVRSLLLRVPAATAVLALVLSGCAFGGQQGAGGSAVEVRNAYVKSTDGSTPMNGEYMTAAFMDLRNNSSNDLTLEGASAAFASDVQVHTVVNGKMVQLKGGLVVKAGSARTLQPGGEHLMFIGVARQLHAGDEVTFTLVFSGGKHVRVTAPVKSMNAGSESYAPAAGSASAATDGTGGMGASATASAMANTGEAASTDATSSM